MVRSERFLLLVSSFLLFAGVLTLYVLTLPNMNTGYADSDELITVAKITGVPHPPGYPLYTLFNIALGNLPIQALSFAGRINLGSSILHAISVVFVFLSGYLLLKRTREGEEFLGEVSHLRDLSTLWSALIGGLSCATAFSFWFYGLFAEVFSLHIFFVSGITCLLVWFGSTNHKSDDTTPSPHLGWLVFGGFLFGLGLANQQTMLFMIPAFGVWIGWGRRDLLQNWKLMGVLAVVSALGFLIAYIYLPLAARGEPVINWENPATVSGLYRSITRRVYAEMSPIGNAYLGGLTIKLADRMNGIVAYNNYVRDNLSVFAIVGCVGGVYLILKKQYRMLSLLVLGVFGGGFFMAVYGPNTTPTDQLYYLVAKGIHERFFLASLPFWGILIGIGSFALMQRFRVWAILGLILSVTVLSGLNFIEVRKNDFTLAREFGRIMLAQLDNQAILFCFSEHSCFTGVYLQEVEGFRRDVLIVHAALYQLPIEQIKKKEPTLVHTTAPRDSPSHAFSIVRDIIRWNIDKRPIYMAGIPTQAKTLSAYGVDHDPFFLVPAGCVMRVSRTFDYAARNTDCEPVDSRAESAFLTPRAPISRMIRDYLASVHYLHAKELADHRCYADTQREFERTILLSPHFVDAQKSLDDLKQQRLTNADCKQSVSGVSSTDVLKKAFKSEKDNDLSHALYYLAQASMIDPRDVSVRLRLARMYKQVDAYENAQIEYQDLLKLDPKHEVAQKELERIKAVRKIEQEM